MEGSDLELELSELDTDGGWLIQPRRSDLGEITQGGIAEIWAINSVRRLMEDGGRGL